MNVKWFVRGFRRAGFGAVIALLGLAFLAGYWFGGGGGAEDQTSSVSHVDLGIEQWTCSMHPQIRLPKQGKCPLCGMDLIPVQAEKSGVASLRQFVTSPEAFALMDIATAPVERRPVTVVIQLAGKMDYDETGLASIAAWAPGRIDRMFVDFVGVEVKKGDPMVSLYSPEILAAQEELRRTSAALQGLRDGTPDVVRQTARATLDAARGRLRRWGLTDEQVRQAEQSGAASDRVTVHAPLSGTVIERVGREGMYVETGTILYEIADLSRIWVNLQAYETDLPWLQKGQPVSFSAEAHPGRTWEGRIAFISPVLDEMTRTVRVRVSASNADGALKPGMFVRATVHARVAADGSVTDQETDPGPLVIPVSAALVTGKRAVAYVALSGEDHPVFEGRDVTLGPRAGDYYVVEAGLREGERVVARGAFKIDSAAQIQGKFSMMSPEETAVAPSGASAKPTTQAPLAFQKQLRAAAAAYASVQEALARDDLTAAQGAGPPLRLAVEKSDAALLQGDAAVGWQETRNAIMTALDAFQSAVSIDEARKAFHGLSDALIAAGETLGFGPGKTAYRVHCPMAFEARGGDWIQFDENVRNPYYGAVMLTCGEVKGPIAPVTGEDAPRE